MKKRIMAALLAVMMIAALLPTTAFAADEAEDVQEEVELLKSDAPTGLGWGRSLNYNYDEETGELLSIELSDSTPGVAYWKTGSEGPQMYCSVELYRKSASGGADEFVYSQEEYYMGGPDTYSAYYFTNNTDVTWEDGTYYFRVTALGDGETYGDSDTVTSGDFAYKKPEAKMPTPTIDPETGVWHLNITDEKLGYMEIHLRYKAEEDAEWTKPNGMSGYTNGSTDIDGMSLSEFGVTLGENLQFFSQDVGVGGAGYYSARIRLMSGDITKWQQCGDYSEWSATYYFDGETATLVTETPAAPTFTDVPENAWYAENVSAAAQSGLIAGFGDNSFDPAGKLTWAQTVTFAVRVAQKNAGEDVYGPDDQTGTWYDVYVDYAKEHGYVDGLAANPNAVMTRADAAVIFAAALGNAAKVNDVPEGHFADVPASGPIHDAVYALAAAGVINGKSANADGTANFGVGDTLLRSEVATIIARMAGLTDTVKIG